MQMQSLNNSEIELLRKLIDKIDDKIIKLIIERNLNSNKIIKQKQQQNSGIIDASREKFIVDNLISKYQQRINPKEINALYNVILKFSKLDFSKLDSKIITNLQALLSLKPFIIAGPCTVESEEQMENTIPQLADLGVKILRGGTFKPRTSHNSFQGLEDEGVKLLRRYADKYQMFTLTEFLDEEQLLRNYDLIDMIQIGSRNMMNFSFLKKVGQITSQDKKPILLKRGYSSTINEFIEAAKYITSSGNNNVILCLRGIRTFEQIDSKMRNTPDLASILELKDSSDLKVVFDPSHSTGNSNYVINISKAAVALGADGIMLETHFDPENALVDGFQSIKPNDLKELIDYIQND